MKAELALQRLRKQIDKADEQILKALAKRSKVVQKIAIAKAKLDLPIVHAARRAEIQKDRAKKGAALGLSEVFMERIFRLIQAESVLCQRKIIAEIKNKKTRSSKGKS